MGQDANKKWIDKVLIKIHTSQHTDTFKAGYSQGAMKVYEHFKGQPQELTTENEALKERVKQLELALQEMYDVFKASDKGFALNMGRDILKQYIK